MSVGAFSGTTDGPLSAVAGSLQDRVSIAQTLAGHGNVGSLSSGSASVGGRLDPGRGGGRSFAGLLGVAQGRTALADAGADEATRKSTEAARKSESREAAEMLLATTFIEPVLKSMRENSQAAPPFAPTPAEKQMRSVLDRQLAHDIVRGGNWALVDRLAEDLMRAGGKA